MGIRIQVIALIFWSNLFMSSCVTIRMDQRNKEMFDAPQQGKMSNDIHNYFFEALTKFNSNVGAEHALINHIPEDKVETTESENYSYNYDASDEGNATTAAPTVASTTAAPTTAAPTTEAPTTTAPTQAPTTTPTPAPTEPPTTAPTNAPTGVAATAAASSTAAPTVASTTAATTQAPTTTPTPAPTESPTTAPTTGTITASFTLTLNGVAEDYLTESMREDIKTGLASLFSVAVTQITLAVSSRRILRNEMRKLTNHVELEVTISQLSSAESSSLATTLDTTESDGSLSQVFEDAGVTVDSVTASDIVLSSSTSEATAGPTSVTIGTGGDGASFIESNRLILSVAIIAVLAIVILSVVCFIRWILKRRQLRNPEHQRLPNFYE